MNVRLLAIFTLMVWALAIGILLAGCMEGRGHAPSNLLGDTLPATRVTR